MGIEAEEVIEAEVAEVSGAVDEVVGTRAEVEDVGATEVVVGVVTTVLEVEVGASEVLEEVGVVRVEVVEVLVVAEAEVVGVVAAVSLLGFASSPVVEVPVEWPVVSVELEPEPVVPI